MVEGFKNTEVGDIPNDWDVKTLGEVGEVKMCKRVFNNETKSTGTIPFYKIGTFGKEADAYISEDLYNNYRQRFSYPNKGDILISAAGTIGRTLIFDGKPSYFQDSNIVWIDNNESLISQKLLYHVFQVVKYNTEGGTIQRLYNSILKNTKFICPPTKVEQTAIATALSDADALISSLEKLIAKKKAMKQGAVQELFKAKKGWQTKSLGDITNIRRGASPRPIKDPKWFSQKGRGWIRISDVTSSNVYLNSTTQYLSEEGVKYSVPVDKGDLIMSICATIGVPVIINIPACIHDGFVLFSNYENNLDTFYLYFFLQKETDALVGKGQPGTQKNLNISIVSNIEISYPSVEEQKKIGLILKDIDIELSGLEQRLEKQKQLKQGMMQSLLTGKIRLV